MTFLVQLVATVAARFRILLGVNLPRLFSDKPVACNDWLLITSREFGLAERDLIRHARDEVRPLTFFELQCRCLFGFLDSPVPKVTNSRSQIVIQKVAAHRNISVRI